LTTNTPPSIRDKLLIVITALTKVYADENNPSGIPDWDDADHGDIAEFIDAWKQVEMDFNKSARGKLEHVMGQRDATELPCGDFIASIVEVPEYNGEVLSMLFEYGLRDELFAKGAVEEIPATLKWSATKVKPFAKRGTREGEIISNARSVKYRTLKVTRR